MEDLEEFNELFGEISLFDQSDGKEKKVNLERLTKKQKKARHFEKIKAVRVDKRNEEHRRQRPARRDRAQYFLETKLYVAIDLSFEKLMNKKEKAHLARQLGRVWGLQKKFDGLDTNLFSLSEEFNEECNRVVTGFDGFDWLANKRPFSGKDLDLVYLSPDPSLPPLKKLDRFKVYVIGGIVDESGVGSKTKEKAERMGAQCFRLPIPEHSTRTTEPGSWTFNQTLSINQVIEILCYYKYEKHWPTALSFVVPKRTGFVFDLESS